MRFAARSLPFDSAKSKTISIDGYLQKGEFVPDDAVVLVLGEVTHVLGGRFVIKGEIPTRIPGFESLLVPIPSNLNSNTCRGARGGTARPDLEWAGHARHGAGPFEHVLGPT